jgi:hypothetical protein
MSGSGKSGEVSPGACYRDVHVQPLNKKPRRDFGYRPDSGGFKERDKLRESVDRWDTCRSMSRANLASRSRPYSRRFRSPVQYSPSREYNGEYDSIYEQERGRGGDRRYSERTPSCHLQYNHGGHQDVQYRHNSRVQSSRHSPQPTKSERGPQRPRTDKSRRKWVEVDRSGKPYSSMVAILHTDLWAFAKEMDPFLNWDKQP